MHVRYRILYIQTVLFAIVIAELIVICYMKDGENLDFTKCLMYCIYIDLSLGAFGGTRQFIPWSKVIAIWTQDSIQVCIQCTCTYR